VAPSAGVTKAALPPLGTTTTGAVQTARTAAQQTLTSAQQTMATATQAPQVLQTKNIVTQPMTAAGNAATTATSSATTAANNAATTATTQLNAAKTTAITAANNTANTATTAVNNAVTKATTAPITEPTVSIPDFPDTTSKAATAAGTAAATQMAAVTPATPAATGNGQFGWPVQGQIISKYGATADGLRNDGINISAPAGAPVVAAADGVVAYAGNELRGFGNMILIRHAGGWVTAYAHNQSLVVKKGDTVKRGQTIARVGQTGNVTAPQLHFEIRKGTTAQDPMQYLGS
jgi:murein DD-endopeptidase MepM/ murein hydrolase activator NlpD